MGLYVKYFMYIILAIVAPLHKLALKWLMKFHLPKSDQLKWQRQEPGPGSSGQ